MRSDADPRPADPRLLERILDSAIDYAMLSTDLEGRVTVWSAGAVRMLGWTAAEMLGQLAEVFFTPEDRAAGVPAAEMRTAREDGRSSVERVQQRRDGSLLWARSELTPLRDGDSVYGYLRIMRDRTPQRNVLEQHRSDAEFLRRVLASSADCINVLDLDARLLFMTEGGQRLMHVTDFEAVRGSFWPELWTSGSRPAALAAVAAAQAGETGHFQGETLTPAGVPTYWDVQVTAILGSDGRPERLLSVARDITATRAAEAALREVQGLNSLILMGSSDCIVVLDLEGRTQYVSPGGIRSMEIADVDAIIGLSWLRVWSGPDHDRAQEAVAQARAGGVGRFQGFCATHKGTPKWWDVVVSPLPGASGMPERLVSTGRDITDLKHAEAETRRAEQALRELAGSLERQVAQRTADRNRMWALSADIMLVVLPDGTVMATNPAWATVLGWQEAELLGSSVFDLIHPDQMEASRAAAAASGSGEAMHRAEVRYRHKDGSWRWIAWTAVAGDGVITAVGRDVTAERTQADALRQTEEALRQSQKMEAVGQLTGGIAHDFNNLLAGITGSLELMQARIAQGRTAELGRYIAAAQGAAQRAAALTHRLLAFSRQQALDPKPTAVNLLVNEMEELLRRTVGPSISLEVLGAAGLWTTMCDPNQLENALLNLCINARDAMGSGGRLTIRTANTVVDADAAHRPPTAPGQYVALSVTDTGIGMTPEVVSRVFEPFFTTKPLGQGTGLGLSMVYGFAKQSGGEAIIESAPGHGTTVTIYLPRHLGDAAADRARDAGHLGAAPRAAAHETVLVVDDEPTVRMLVAEVLHGLGYMAIEAADGSAGLDILHSAATIDLLVTDVGLPGGMNGRQLADAARERRPGLKVLFITGYAENAALGPGPIGPGMHVLTKPFALDTLARTVKAMLATA